MRKTLLCTLLILVPFAALAERPVEVTRPAAADAKISIELVAGSLVVTGTDANELRITGTLGDDVEELDIEVSGKKISVEVVIPRDGGSRRARDIAAELEVLVPRGARLELEGVSAPVEVRDVRGQIEAASVSGNVVVSGAAAEVEVESVSGKVSVSGGGPVAAESVSGSVELEGVTGDLEVSTVSGAIGIAAGAVEDVEIDTVSGNVRFAGRPGADSKLEVESHSGNVQLALPADLGAVFDLTTFSGRIDAGGLGPVSGHGDRRRRGQGASFTTGGGGARVSVETFSGNIRLEQL